MINPITGDELPNKWKVIKVDSIKSSERYSCVAGPFGSDISSKYFENEGIPVIRGNNLSLNYEKFKAEGFVFVSEQRALKYKGQHVEANDLIFTCWGTLGQVGIIPEDGPFEKYIISNKQLKLRVNKEVVNPIYLYYYFSSPYLVKYINNIAIGAAVPGINLGLLKNLPVVLPSLKVQNKIAVVIDHYYDLIENNNQRIQLLEEMAAEIYKEWFVRFRFPGYESATFVDKEGKEVSHGTDGALPLGWEKIKFRNCLSHYIGGGWGKDIPTGKSIVPAHVIRGTDIPNLRKGQLNYNVLRFHTESNLSNRRCIPNDIIFEVSGGTEEQSLGRTVFITQGILDRFGDDVIGASFCKLLRINQDIISPFYINALLNRMYCTGELKVFQVQSTGISNYQFEDFIDSTKVLKPVKNITEQFDKTVATIVDEIQLLGAKNETLQQTRDLLLPRLISGKLSVENLSLSDIEAASMVDS